LYGQPLNLEKETAKALSRSD